MNMLATRQIHLDFHTSPYIPDVAKDFDPERFAATFKAASVNSVTVFARCHHGHVYYDSKFSPERIHPSLKCKDLLPMQVEALHKQGIRAPVYTTVQWDWFSANQHPEWLIRKADGAHEGGPFTEPGFYQSLCVNTGYYDFLAAHTEEVMELLGDSLDGFFFDIMGIRPCLCAACRAEMKREGIDMTDEAAVRAFAVMSIERFKRKMSALVRARRPEATIFYNAGHVGPCTRASKDTYSHFELESLPSGSWGYLHFPVTARYARTLGLPCLGMTGKFHTEWGDFHSLKNLAALEFECFRMLSYGFSSSIGDQLEPFGELGDACYERVGAVYSRFAQYEPWAIPSKPLVEAALVTPEDPHGEFRIPESVLGACQLLEELSLQFDIIDQGMSLDQYPLVILPDDLIVCEDFRRKLDGYTSKGGKVLAIGRGGQGKDGECPECFGVRYAGESRLYPDFLIADGPLAEGLYPGNEYVIYLRGQRHEATRAQPILNARAPFFSRVGDHFCSHRYTPSAKGAAYPVGFQNGNVLLLSHPMFEQYRHNAPQWVKTVISKALGMLLPDRLVTHDGPSTLTVSALAQPEQGRVNLHVLSYIPVRKSATIDLVEERTPAYNVTLALGGAIRAKSARLVPCGTPLEIKDSRVTIPKVDGYSIVELTV